MTNKKTSKRNETSAAAKVAVIKLGADLHAASVTVTVQLDDSTPQPPQKIAIERFLEWVRELKSRHSNAVVHACYEAGPCGYWLHRQLVAEGVRNVVVAPVMLNGRRKNDPRDSRALGEQLDRYVRGHTRAFSVVRVPTPEQEQQRALARHKEQLSRALRRAAQQGRSLLLLHGWRERGWWWGPRRWAELSRRVPDWLRELLADFQAQARLLHGQLRAITAKIAALRADAAAAPLPYGLGVITDRILALEVLDWSRFDNRRQVASYFGLCPSEWSSGETRREGSIDKQGNAHLRRALIQTVWRLWRWQPGYAPLERLRQARGSRSRRRALVAVARRLAIDLWRLATGRTTLEKLGLSVLPPPKVKLEAA